MLTVMIGMMKNDKLKIEIISYLSTSTHSKISPSRLAQVLNYKYETVNKALLFLEKLNLVAKISEKHGKKTYNYFGLTPLGRKVSHTLRSGGKQ